MRDLSSEESKGRLLTGLTNEGSCWFSHSHGHTYAHKCVR